jgi:hypothetical protein
MPHTFNIAFTADVIAELKIFKKFSGGCLWADNGTGVTLCLRQSRRCHKRPFKIAPKTAEIKIRNPSKVLRSITVPTETTTKIGLGVLVQTQRFFAVCLSIVPPVYSAETNRAPLGYPERKESSAADITVYRPEGGSVFIISVLIIKNGNRTGSTALYIIFNPLVPAETNASGFAKHNAIKAAQKRITEIRIKRIYYMNIIFIVKI